MTRTFDQARVQFLSYLEQVKDVSPHTLRSYDTDLGQFKNFLLSLSPSLLDLTQIDKKILRSFLSHLTLKGSSKRTLVRRLASLRSFFRFLEKSRFISQNPLDHIETPKLEKRIPHPLSYPQVELLLSQPDTSSLLGLRDRCLMELLYSSGIRIGELAGLNRKDLDLTSKTLLIRGKGKKERKIPITSTAAKWLGTYLNHPTRYLDEETHHAEQDSEAIFLNKWGNRISVRSLDRNFAKYFSASSLSSKVTPHTIRHTIATHWLENGMDLKTIQALLGHSCLTTTTIYTKVSTRLKKEVYDQTHPLAKQQHT